MKETDLKKTDSAVSCIRYLFDPDDQLLPIRWTTITVREESALPEFGKVVHLCGRRYAVYFDGAPYNTPEKKKIATDLFKKFYLNKLADAAEEVSKFATILTYFE